MGYCSKKEEIITALEYGKDCNSFEKRTNESLISLLEKKGWVYCVGCSETLVSTEELIAHLDQKHLVFEGVFVDDSIIEESYAGD